MFRFLTSTCLPVLGFWWVSLLPVSGVEPGEEVELDVVWPTPNPAFLQGKPLETFIQPTVSGRTESALFGCVRNGGARFHEGLDLKTLGRDSRNEATDPIYAAFRGRVVHINKTAGHSSYGRYLVLEHRDLYPAVYTLYAHLARVADGLTVGDQVEAGQTIGIMGRSAGGYSIPKSRAHLHFEIGLRLSDDFQSWYSAKGFGSRNEHGLWNGMNLIGMDPLDFFRELLGGRVLGPFGYIDNQPTACSLRIFTQEIPDFVKRYPELIAGELRADSLVAWDIDFTWYNMPIRWVPRYQEDIGTGKPGSLQLISFDREEVERQRCRRVLQFSGNRVLLGSGLKQVLEILFEMYRG